jgi:hypothetical protein
VKRIQQGIDGLGQPLFQSAQQSDSILNYVMVANTAQYVTVPTGANFVLFAATGGSDFWMQLGVTSGLSIPSANQTSGSNPQLNPVLVALQGATSIGLISGGSPTICMSFFS